MAKFRKYCKYGYYINISTTTEPEQGQQKQQQQLRNSQDHDYYVARGQKHETYVIQDRLVISNKCKKNMNANVGKNHLYHDSKIFS